MEGARKAAQVVVNRAIQHVHDHGKTLTVESEAVLSEVIERTMGRRWESITSSVRRLSSRGLKRQAQKEFTSQLLVTGIVAATVFMAETGAGIERG